MISVLSVKRSIQINLFFRCKAHCEVRGEFVWDIGREKKGNGEEYEATDVGVGVDVVDGIDCYNLLVRRQK